MPRGGRSIYKKTESSSGRKRKGRSNTDDDDDDGDEEYVLGEEVEESESDYESDVNSRNLSDEESLEFSESDNDEDEEKDFKIARSKTNQRNSRKAKVSDDEMEDLKLPKPKKKGRRTPRKQKSRYSDYEFDDEDDDDEDFSPDEDDFDEDEAIVSKKKRGVKNLGKKQRSKVSKMKGRKKRRTVSSPARKRQKSTIENSDDDFVLKDRVLVGRKRTEIKNVRKKKSTVDSASLDSEFVKSDDDFIEKGHVTNNRRKNSKRVKKTAGTKRRKKKRSADDSESWDSDFVISDDDNFDVKDGVVFDKQQQNSRRVKKTVESKGTKKRSVEDSESSASDFMISDDDDFDVKDQVAVHRQQENNKKVVGSNKRRKRSSVVPESSDSEYLISEEDDEFLLEDQVVVDEWQKKARKRRTEPKRTRRRSSSLVDSDSVSFNVDNVISEEEIKDLRIIGGLQQEKPKSLVAGKKEEEKGKEKQAADSGNQVCGICLSEEKKTVVQGLLNCCFHYFCFACIMEWSKVESRCPVCKRRFETITKAGRSDPGFGMRSAVIRVQKRDQVYQPSEEELRGMLDPYENVVCMECQQGGDDNLMLLCDVCDSSAHTYCVGLGREVPEGNWYCECCRSVSDGPPHSQFQDTMPDQEAINSNLFPSVTERCGFTSMHISTNSPQPVSISGRSSLLRIDLNSSPRDFPGEDHFVSSPISGSGASTVSGRRHIRQRIHVILSTNRQRQTSAWTNMLCPNSAADTPRNGEDLTVSGNQSPLPSVSSFEQWQQNPRSFFRSNTSLAPRMFNEGSSLRHVDGAKEEVKHMVKSHLENMSRNRILERSTFKEIAENSTHTILAACGIEHCRSMVSASVEPPDNCTHDLDDGPAHLLKGCCSSCFSSFVKDVVQRLINAT